MGALVVVPTYNEVDNLRPLVEAVLRLPDVDMMIVDDGSPDGTGALADTLAMEHRGRVQVVHRTGPRGFGRSYVDGMQRALRIAHADVVCQMDADLSHLPADLPRLIDGAKDADLVIGSRYVDGGRVENWPWRRLVLSRFANQYVRTLTRIPVRDITSGFRCWRRQVLEDIPLAELQSDGYAFQVEMTWHADRLGRRIVEVPITFVERRQGQSKLSGRVVVESAALPWRLLMR